MSIKTVGMITSYHSITQSDWLWQQTPHPFGVWGNIQMSAPTSKPDILLLYNFQFPSLKPKKQQFNLFKPKPNVEQEIQAKLRGVPKERIVSLVREPPFPEKLQERERAYRRSQIYCGHVSGPDDLAPNPDYMPAIWYHANSFRELNEMGVPEKVQTCSWITSGVDRTNNHLKRLSFLKLLRDQGLDFDLYGRNLPDWSGGKGFLDNKWGAMAPYYYNLSVENYADNDWYVSEKLWDALLAWCLPIYYGGPAADRLLPPGSFLRLPSMDEKGFNYIKEVTATPDAWFAAKDAIAEARQIILHKLNLLNWLSDFVSKLE
ncbi:MAG: glycosyltransferase [Leptolyngbyaceae cyanobacterium RM1_406_9]|nr:glycosyltransferase [Leptolyngbyaceae cyanobacterium RM1_406_9]